MHFHLPLPPRAAPNRATRLRKGGSCSRRDSELDFHGQEWPWNSGMHWSDNRIFVHSYGDHPHGGPVRCGWRRTAAKCEEDDYDRLWAQCAGNVGSHFCSRYARGLVQKMMSELFFQWGLFGFGGDTKKNMRFWCDTRFWWWHPTFFRFWW